MKKEYFQKEVKKGDHSKKMKNIAAMQSATRDEDRIVYDSKKPLIINDKYPIYTYWLAIFYFIYRVYFFAQISEI